MAKTIGQAYDKSEKWLYTWFEDGTVCRQCVVRYPGGTTGHGMPEIIEPPIRWNGRMFWAFVPAELKADFGVPDGGPCPDCGGTNTRRIDAMSNNSAIWLCRCGSCGEVFEVSNTNDGP